MRSALAVGLVFGAGAAATDASWTDQEYAAGTFTTGSFDLLSSIDGSTYTEHPVGSPAAMQFNAAGLYPTAVVAAPFDVRLAAGSVPGHVALSLSSTSGNAALLAALQYRVYVDTTAGTCSATSTPNATTGSWIAGNATTWVTGLTTAVPTNSTALPAASAAAQGAPVYYCFTVQLPSSAANTLQGQTATATWVATGSTP